MRHTAERSGQRGWPLLALVLLAVPNAQAQDALRTSPLLTNSVFHRTDAVGDRFELIGGPMLFQQRDDERYSRGYRPQSVVTLAGTLRREVYDFAPERRAHGLFRQVTAKLAGAGYETKYQCERQTCGDVAGWRLYLSNLIGGPEATQYYHLASGAPQAGAEAPHIALYINELDGQSRLLIDYLVPDGADPGAALSDAPNTRSSVGHSIAFAKSSERPDAASAKALRAISESIQAANPERVYRIVGHTDSDGGLLANICLSARRAQRVRQLLVQTYGVAERRLVAYGLGPLVPQASNADITAKAGNRRVEVFAAGHARASEAAQAALTTR